MKPRTGIVIVLGVGAAVALPRMLSDYPDFDVRFGSGGRVEDARVPGYIEPGILANLGVEGASVGDR